MACISLARPPHIAHRARVPSLGARAIVGYGRLCTANEHGHRGNRLKRARLPRERAQRAKAGSERGYSGE